MKILDTSSLVCILKEIKYPKILDLCEKDGHHLIIPEPVYEELIEEPESFAKFKERGSITVVQVDKDSCALIKRRYPWMGKGEIGVFSYALSCKQLGERYFCVLDDNPAKLKGRMNLEIQATGTIGLLKWQKQKGAINQKESEDLYYKFLKSSCYIKIEILEELIR